MESKGLRTRQTRLITLESETDFEGWRKAARTLVHNGAKPSEVTWTVRGHEAELPAPVEAPLEAPRGTFNVPRKFVELAKSAILHRDGQRFALLYRLLWRLRSDRRMRSDVSWFEASGLGTIYSFAIVRRAGGPWRDSLPYVLAYVELEEGPRVLTNVTGTIDLDVGQAVVAEFHDTGEGNALVRFRPA